jgi:DNA-binding transcriptional ArsR family regulator
MRHARTRRRADEYDAVRGAAELFRHARSPQLAVLASALDKNSCQDHDGQMHDVEVIESAEAAAVALDPVRARLLGELVVPASAAGLAARVGIGRQNVRYHLKALEAHGLVTLSEERRHGGITERVLQASAAAYVVSPAAVSVSAADPAANTDHLSASYLVALAGRLVREVGALARRVGATGKRLPTLTIDTEIGFRSAADRAAFADELTAAVLDLAARYHHDDGRPYRLVVAAHPRPGEES